MRLLPLLSSLILVAGCAVNTPEASPPPAMSPPTGSPGASSTDSAGGASGSSGGAPVSSGGASGSSGGASGSSAPADSSWHLSNGFDATSEITFVSGPPNSGDIVPVTGDWNNG